MERTLWILSYEVNGCGSLVQFYAIDESEAWEKAVEWANKQGIIIPSEAKMLHYPGGFLVFQFVIPGTGPR